MSVKPGSEKKVAKKLLELNEIENLHILLGEFDLIAKIKSENNLTLQAFLLDKIRKIKDIRLTHTLIASDV